MPISLQFLRKETAQIFLFFGRGAGRRGGIRLRVDFDVTQKALNDGVGELRIAVTAGSGGRRAPIIGQATKTPSRCRDAVRNGV